MGSMRISPSPKVTVVDVENSLMHKTCFIGPEIVFIELSGSMLLMQPFTELHP
jgi:hypothetical protein